MAFVRRHVHATGGTDSKLGCPHAKWTGSSNRSPAAVLTQLSPLFVGITLDHTCRDRVHSAAAAQNRHRCSAGVATRCPATMKVTAVVAVVLCALAATVSSAQAQNLTDTNILNFALNLEYLEASFYHCAVTGDPLPPSITGNGPTPTGCKKANLTGNTLVIANELLADEQAHVVYLRTALGADAVDIPQINIGTAFSAAANAAFNTTLNPSFDPYANDIFFIHGAFIFEDVGVTAYQGAAALIKNKTYLTPAAGILAVEAYHAGIIRSELYKIRDTQTPYGVNVQTIVDNIAKLRATASMAADDQGIVLNGTANIVDANTTTSITFPRTPTQVLNIVTVGNGTVGGFFPDGVMLSA